MLLLTMYQASVVPSQNHNVEFTHNERVQSELLDVRNGIIRAATTGNTQPGSVRLGTMFPSRIIAVNPAPAGGTVGPSSVRGNATITGAEPLNRDARNYWSNGSHSMSYRTQGFTYEPSYREYDTAPTTVYENTVLYNEFPNGQNRTISGQSIVDGRTISLIAVQEIPTKSSSGTVGMDIHPLSPSSTQLRTIAVTNETPTEPVNVTLPTQLTQQRWSRLLENELDDGYVESVSVSDGNVTIKMKQVVDGSQVTYNLRTAAVTASRSPKQPEPAYVTVVDGANRSVPENTTSTLVAEVRDRYNNPVSGAKVNATFNNAVRSLSGTQFLQHRSTEQGITPFEFETTGDGSAQFSLTESTQQATLSIAGFSKDETSRAELRSPSNQTRTSSPTGRVRLSYSASGTGSLSATLKASTASTSADFSVYSLETSNGGAVIVDDEGNRQEITHDEINQGDYSNSTLYVPEGETLGPEDGSEDIEYTFKEYDIEGEISTDQRLSLTATDGDISFADGSTAISGREINFVAENGDINVDGATIETTSGDGGQGNEGITLDAAGNISAVGTTMETGSDIELLAGGWIDVTDGSLTSTGNGNIDITAGEYVDLIRTILDIQGNAGNVGASAEGTAIDDTDIDLRGKADPLDKTTV